MSMAKITGTVAAKNATHLLAHVRGSGVCRVFVRVRAASFLRRAGVG